MQLLSLASNLFLFLLKYILALDGNANIEVSKIEQLTNRSYPPQFEQALLLSGLFCLDDSPTAILSPRLAFLTNNS